MVMTLDVPVEIEQRLDRLSEATGYSKSLFYPELMRMGIDDLEDYFEATKASEDIRSGRDHVVSSAEVRASLGLDD